MDFSNSNSTKILIVEDDAYMQAVRRQTKVNQGLCSVSV